MSWNKIMLCSKISLYSLIFSLLVWRFLYSFFFLKNILIHAKFRVFFFPVHAYRKTRLKNSFFAAFGGYFCFFQFYIPYFLLIHRNPCKILPNLHLVSQRDIAAFLTTFYNQHHLVKILLSYKHRCFSYSVFKFHN